MNKKEAIELINALPENCIISLVVSTVANGGPVDPPDDLTIQGRVVEIEEKESFKKVDYYNEKGKPVMKSAKVGWHTNEGERYFVEVDFISGDSGYRWWRIIEGPGGASDESLTFGLYIDKEKTKIII